MERSFIGLIKKTLIKDASRDCRHGCPLNLSSYKVAAVMANILLLIFYFSNTYKNVLLDCWITFCPKCLHIKMCAPCLQRAMCFNVKFKSFSSEWTERRTPKKSCLLSNRTSSSSSLAKLLRLTSCFLARCWSKRFTPLPPEQSADTRSSLLLADMFKWLKALFLFI